MDNGGKEQSIALEIEYYWEIQSTRQMNWGAESESVLDLNRHLRIEF